MEKLYFNQDGIKGGGVAQVSKFFRSKHINVPVLRTQLGPREPRANHTGLQHAVYFGFQKYIATTVEDAHLVAICDAARSGISGIHLKQACFLHLLDCG